MYSLGFKVEGLGQQDLQKSELIMSICGSPCQHAWQPNKPAGVRVEGSAAELENPKP